MDTEADTKCHVRFESHFFWPFSFIPLSLIKETFCRKIYKSCCKKEPEHSWKAGKPDESLIRNLEGLPESINRKPARFCCSADSRY